MTTAQPTALAFRWHRAARWLGPLVVAGLILLLLRASAVSLSHDHRWLLLGFLLVPTAVVGALAGAIWFGRRDERAFLWLAVACLCGCLYSLPRVVTLPFDDHWVVAASLVALSAYISASVLLGQHLFRQTMVGFERSLGLCVGAVAALSFTVAAAWPESMPEVSKGVYAGLLIYGFTLNVVVYVVEHLRRPTVLSFVMQVTAHCMGAAVLWEAALLADGSWWRTPSWFLMMAPMAVVVVTFWLLQRFGQALGDAQRWAETLEQQVAARELEVAESYERLRRAEQEGAIAQERERLFRDMHDGFGGTLVLTLSRLLNSGGENTAMARALQSALNDLRLILSSLMPGRTSLRVALADLHARLAELAEDESTRLQLHIAGSVDARALPPSVMLQVLRIVQEACINSVQHARARHIRVIVTETAAHPGQLTIQVEDDGCGFDPARPAGPGRYGLIQQRQRALQIGAQLGFEQLSPGMRVTLRLPAV